MKNRNLDHKDHWMTPPKLYEKLNKEFNFDFDPCPLHHDVNKWDGLEVEWGPRNFINPPYSQKLKEAFIMKAVEQSKLGKLCVMLLPVSTSTKIFHELIQLKSIAIRFVKRRIPFIGINSKGQRVNYHLIQNTKDEIIHYLIDEQEKIIPKYIKNNGQHDSMIVIF